MNAQDHAVLRNVIAVARRELADLDADDVPQRLRRVARSSSRRLPPPLAESLLRELRDSEEFRSAVRERWEEEGIEDPVGLAFLDDPDAGLEQVAEASKDARIESLERELAEAVATVAALEGRLAEAKKRVAEARSEREAALRSRSEAEEAVRRGTARRIRELETALRDTESERDDLAGRVEDLETQLEAANQRISRMARRRDRDGPVAAPVAYDPRSVQPPREPVAFAAWLDTVERVQRPFREPDLIAVAADDPGPITIPGGIGPDTREAVEAVVAQKPDTVVIDGYNVAALCTPGDFSNQAARASVVAKAERLAARSGAKVIVVFDSTDAGGRNALVSPGGVEVLFSQHRSADDEIVDIVESRGDRTVVVTTDRELRHRCEACGAVPLWSNGFIEWANR